VTQWTDGVACCQDMQRLLSVERKISKVVTLVERGVEKTEVQRFVARLESDVKVRVEAVLEVRAAIESW